MEEQKINKNFLKKGFEHKLEILDGDEDYSNVVEVFLDSLQTNVVKYRRNINKKEKQSKELGIINNIKFNFEPEEIVRKSPMTLLDAKWGLGKTFFIEKVFEKLINNTTKNSYFQTGLIIDAWKLSTSENVVSQLFSEVFIKLIKTNMEFWDKAEESLLKFAFFTFDKVTDVIEHKTGLKVKKVKYDEFKSIKKQIDKKLKPTIIFIDNIERVGPEAWDILKATSRLQELDNLVIVLPINLNKFRSGDEYKGTSEFPIEKFVDIPHFKFVPNYRSALTNIIKMRDDIDFYVQSLESVIEDTQLSIRELKKRMQQAKLNDISGQIERYIKFTSNVWGNVDVLEEFVASKCNGSAEYAESIILALKKEINEMNEKIKEIYRSLNSQKIKDHGVFQKIQIEIEAISDLPLSGTSNKKIDRLLKLLTVLKDLLDSHLIEFKNELKEINNSVNDLDETEAYIGNKILKNEKNSEKLKIEVERLREILAKDKNLVFEQDKRVSGPAKMRIPPNELLEEEKNKQLIELENILSEDREKLKDISDKIRPLRKKVVILEGDIKSIEEFLEMIDIKENIDTLKEYNSLLSEEIPKLILDVFEEENIKDRSQIRLVVEKIMDGVKISD